jgi:hypothetical protein
MSHHDYVGQPRLVGDNIWFSPDYHRKASGCDVGLWSRIGYG